MIKMICFFDFVLFIKTSGTERYRRTIQAYDSYFANMIKKRKSGKHI